MDDHALLRRHHENYRETWALPLGAAPFTGRRAGGLLVVLSHLPVRYFNQIVVEDDPRAITPVALAEAIGLAEASGQPFMVVLRDGIDDAVRRLAEDRGLVALGDGPSFPAMALHPLPTPVPAPSGLDIRRVTHARDLDAWEAVVAVGFTTPPETVRAALRPLISLPASWNYVGYEDGRPVVVGQGILTGSTIGVYTIATMPDARRRGYGAAITRRIVADGAAAGADVAILQASAMGRPVYEAIGFRTVGSYTQLGDRTPEPAG